MPKIAIIIEKHYEDLELYYPFIRLSKEGFDFDIIAPEKNKTYKGEWGYPVISDLCIDEANPSDYDGILIPGGRSPDYLRIIPNVLNFVQKTNELNKLIISICHGPSVLISAKIIKGKHCTSYKAIKDDLENANAIWEDCSVVIDGNLITSRTPMDLEHMAIAILEYFK